MWRSTDRAPVTLEQIAVSFDGPRARADALCLVGPDGDLDLVTRAEFCHEAGEVELGGAEADVE